MAAGLSRDDELARLRRTVAALEIALRTARQAADVEHKAADLARESAARAWSVSSGLRGRPPRDA